MKFLDSLSFRIAALFHPSRVDTEMGEELQSHIQLRADDLERSGLPRLEAERRARIEFGGREKYKEECHEALGNHLLETLIQDVRFSLRVLRQSPGFSIAAVLTLALAIGANAVVFSMFNSLALRPLNVPQSQSLYAIQRGNEKYILQSYPDYLDLRDRNRSFDGLAAYTIVQAALDTGKDPSQVWLYEVSGNYFDALRIQPYLGHFFHGSDEHGANSAPYIVLTYAYWHNHFQDDRGVVGRVVQLNKHPFTILGVAPPEFHGTLMIYSPDFFVPMVNAEQIERVSFLNARGERWVFEVLGHLKARVTPKQAVADLNSVGSYLGRTYPKDDGSTSFSLVRPALHGDFFAPAIRAFLAGLMLLAGLILLAACANLGSLFAARAADRGREVALRLALGSSRNRILRQLFTEAVLISLVGGTVGLLGSVALLHGLSAWQPFPRYPMHVPVEPDAHVYVVALLLTLVSGFLFGAVPVKQILRTNPYDVIKSGSTGSPRLGRRITLRDMLLVVQIAICAVLVTSSMVAVLGLLRSLHGNFGFEPRNVMLANTDLGMAGYSDDRVPAMQKRMLDQVESIPGVSSVGLVGPCQPLTMGGVTPLVFNDKTSDMRESNAAAKAFMYNISPGILPRGGHCLAGGKGSVLARRQKLSARSRSQSYLCRQNLRLHTECAGRTLQDEGWNASRSRGYCRRRKILQSRRRSTAGHLSSHPAIPSERVLAGGAFGSRSAASGAAIRSKLRELDAGLPVYIQPWSKEMDGALFASRVATVSLGVLGMMGAMLSITGIFGMAAYSVSKRLRELGIRIAVGARRTEVLQAALGRAFKLLAIGSAAGLLLGLLATRVLAFIVYQATPRDPLVLAGVVLAMSFLGLLATWIPAQRALSIDPVILLRAE